MKKSQIKNMKLVNCFSTDFFRLRYYNIHNCFCNRHALFVCVLFCLFVCFVLFYFCFRLNIYFTCVFHYHFPVLKIKYVRRDGTSLKFHWMMINKWYANIFHYKEKHRTFGTIPVDGIRFFCSILIKLTQRSCFIVYSWFWETTSMLYLKEWWMLCLYRFLLDIFCVC